jgi:hypothetical protein
MVQTNALGGVADTGRVGGASAQAVAKAQRSMSKAPDPGLYQPGERPYFSQKSVVLSRKSILSFSDY